MRELETTLTQKGQVTIPVEIRSRLGLKPKDKVRFEVEGDEVKIKPAPSRIARHFGAVAVSGKSLDWRVERKAFEEGVAEEVVAEDR
ncbi:AbrB/MazE/SpoVT family DNA-binding domain-containing protein [Candidatus Daviesbacteria bacterium]|nr:AbrB/MazE/SpoVT family DNA-binding domain-containing protein [Candidatus Daviesbacteria bacterium]